MSQQGMSFAWLLPFYLLYLRNDVCDLFTVVWQDAHRHHCAWPMASKQQLIAKPASADRIERFFEKILLRISTS
jgi:hypothetical protein